MRNVLPPDLDALIITDPYNILYLAGFKGFSDIEREAILVLNPNPTLITARLYQVEANKLKSKILDVKLASERDEILKFVFELLKGKKKIGFEEKSLTVSEFNTFTKLLPGKELIATKNLIENIRQIKTEGEIHKIEKAQIISQKALKQLLPTIKVGQTELEIAKNLESIIHHLLSSNQLAFETIIASGPNTGIPHHRTGNRKIRKGDTLLFDFGAKYQNYCADLSRTIFIGKPSDRQINIYNHVISAQKLAISKLLKEMKLKDAYNLANDLFKSKKLHDYFTHGLGHGIGLEVHELPYLRNNADEPFENGMVFSVEPGLYFPWGGVRIEDLVVIENGKPRVLGKMQEGIKII